MSKFIDAIEVKFTGREVAFPGNLSPLSVSVEFADDTPLTYIETGREYDIGVQYKFRVNCRPRDLNSMKQNIVRQLRDVIYGDLKQHIIELERAVYEGKYGQVQSKIGDILKEVHG